MTRYVAYQQWVDKTFEDSYQGIHGINVSLMTVVKTYLML